MKSQISLNSLIKDRYKSGQSIREIADITGLSRWSVTKRIILSGTEIRPRGDRPGPMSFHWKGGRGTVDAHGYLVVRIKGKNYYVARLLMEKNIGRKLKPWEVVHHKNGIKTDNRKRNLSLFPSQGDHVIKHAKDRKITREK